MTQGTWRSAWSAQRAAEFSCEECFEALDTYVELELAGADADAAVPRMRAHLEGCSACCGDHDSLLALLLSDREDAR